MTYLKLLQKCAIIGGMWIKSIENLYIWNVLLEPSGYTRKHRELLNNAGRDACGSLSMQAKMPAVHKAKMPAVHERDMEAYRLGYFLFLCYCIVKVTYSAFSYIKHGRL